MPFWNANSTTLANDVMYVNNTYKDASGKNKLTTITATNTTGYRDVLEGSTARIGDKPPGLKGLSYAVQTDGKITYKYDDGTGNIKQYNSIQEFANSSIVGYDANTTLRIKDSMQKNLKSGVDSYNAANPSSKINANQATTAPQTGDGSQPAQPIDLDKEVKGSNKTRNQFPELVYPDDIRKTKQDIIKFTMLEYQPKKFGNLTGQGQSNLGGVSERDSTRSGIGYVILPIPSGISDTNAVTWNGGDLDAAKAFAANVALTGITQGGVAAGEKVKEGVEGLQQNSGEAATGLAALFGAAAVGTDAGQLLSRTQGAVINPNMELLFQGPTLRPFNFTFKMSARNSAESKQIISIIRFFKQGMSAQKSASNLFLKAPHTFRVQYIHRPKGNVDHPYIGKIKECALQSFTVNYTPEGQYATFRDGVLVSYEITMQFQELEPIFNEDYGKGSGNNGPDLEIGY